MTHNPAVEGLIIFFFGLCAYISSDLASLSGVISVLVAGIIMAHFSYYNISERGKVTSRVFLNSLALVSEAFIYIYLGISIWALAYSDSDAAWSWNFTLFELIITFIARALSIGIPSVIFRK